MQLQSASREVRFDSFRLCARGRRLWFRDASDCGGSKWC